VNSVGSSSLTVPETSTVLSFEDAVGALFFRQPAPPMATINKKIPTKLRADRETETSITDNKK
jgi:hypothetical protein